MRSKMLLIAMMTAMVFSACGQENIGETSQSLNGLSQNESTATADAPETIVSENDAQNAIVWVPEEAPAVRNELSEEEKWNRQTEILEQGTLLFSGGTDEGYYPEDQPEWLVTANTEDALAIVYGCDDATHGGWGVLGVGLDGGNGWCQEDILAATDNPAKSRLVIYTMEDLLRLSGAEEISQIQSFAIGAWQGGRIDGVYFLSAEVAGELYAYQEEIAETEQIVHTYTGALSNENATENAQIVYDYLKEIYGTACLTGQMESTWMGSPDYEMNYIEDNTGYLPAIRGLDFMHNDFEGVTQRAKDWWERGGIVTICWHTGADFASGYNESLADNINWEEAFVPGSETYNALLAGMDRAVPYLQELEDAGVPVLWRPFHELDGGWFWWSKGGSDNFVKLWQLMYSRYTDYWGLDNLIWVYGYSSSGGDMASWYPGDGYVDIVGADSYDNGPNEHLYEECETVAPEGMPLAFHECGVIPTEEEMNSSGANWLFFMTWHTDWLTNTGDGNTIELLNEVYGGEYFITLDELPDFIP